MVRPDKVKYMVRMAMFEKDHKNELEIASNYRKNDYVSMMRIVSFIVGSIVIMVIYTLAAVLYFYKMNSFHTRTIFIFFFSAIIFYIFFMFFHLRRASINAEKRYDRSMKLNKEWKKLTQDFEKMLDEEDKEEA
jgi:predicted membrane channel-forming protein YqfA (hemolysin III family)